MGHFISCNKNWFRICWPLHVCFFENVSSFCFALLIVFLTKNLNVSLAKERLIWYLGLLNVFSFLIQYVGMNYTTASKSSLLVNLSAIWVAVLSWSILKERFSKKKMSGIALGVIGVFFVTTNLDPVALTQGMILGDGLVFLAGIIWSFSWYITRDWLIPTTSFNLCHGFSWQQLCLWFRLFLFLPIFLWWISQLKHGW